MKKYLIAFFSIMLLSTSCEKNDILTEISEPGEFSSNIYFKPLSPIAFPGTDVELEMEYWTIGDQFQYIGLWESVNLNQKITFSLSGVTYSYEEEYVPELPDPSEKTTFTHSFVNWVPARSAYVLNTEYSVPMEFKKTVFTQTSLTAEQVFSRIPADFEATIYSDLTHGLNRSQLEELLVNIHEVTTLELFNTWFDENGVKTESGVVALMEKLHSIGLENMVNTNYTLTEVHRVYLQWRIRNGKGAESESIFRAFNIN